MRFAGGIIVLAALASPAVAFAQASTAPSATDERRLTPEQIEAVLADAAAKRAAAERPVPADIPATEESKAPPVIGPIHGEVGVSVGTGGYREVFGTAVYPMGQDGVAAFSLDFVDWGHRRFPR